MATASFSTEGLTHEEVIVLVRATVAELNWYYGLVHPLRIEARTRMSAFSYGEDIRIEIGEVKATVTSRHERKWSMGAKKRDVRNVERFIEAFARVRVAMTPERMRSELAELTASAIMQQDANILVEQPSSWKDAFVFFIPGKTLFATPLLIDASVIVYIVIVLSGVSFMEPTTDDLLGWGANFRPVTLGGEWWRLFTCCFVHIGLLHLVFNMYALAMVGIYLEPLLGRWRTLVLYSVTGVCASLTSLWWHENIVSAGASGAIFGLYGVFIALLMTDLLHRDVRKGLLSSMGIFVVYNLMYGVKGGVDNAAHIGGLVSGFLFGFATYLALRKPEQRSLAWITIGAPSLVLLVTGFAVVRTLPGDDHVFVERMDAFQRIEEQGLAAFHMSEGATGLDQLKVVQDSCLPAWHNAVELLRGTQDLHLSGSMSERRSLVTEYCDARLRNIELLEAVLQRGDTAMSPELEASFAQVDSLLKVLNADGN